MSPIGRVFVVLNLLLAGAFVGFAGTYLQKATDWKAKHDSLQTQSSAEIAAANERFETARNDVEDWKRRHTQADTQLNRLDAENKDLRAENERLDKKLGDLQGNLASLQASYATVAASVDRSTTDAAAARKDAIASSAARDEAIRARATAEADLRDANAQIATLTETVSARDAMIAGLEAKNRESEILLAVVNDKAPGLLAQAQPTLGGTVQHVGANGKLLTITVTENPQGAEIKAGYSFAIFRGGVYKGEAQVTEVDGNHAFCKVTAPGGAPIAVGDSATTNTY